jgi:hypothetical protein
VESIEKITEVVASQHVCIDYKNNSDSSCNINPMYAFRWHFKKYPTNNRLLSTRLESNKR